VGAGPEPGAPAAGPGAASGRGRVRRGHRGPSKGGMVRGCRFRAGRTIPCAGAAGVVAANSVRYASSRGLPRRSELLSMGQAVATGSHGAEQCPGQRGPPRGPTPVFPNGCCLTSLDEWTALRRTARPQAGRHGMRPGSMLGHLRRLSRTIYPAFAEIFRHCATRKNGRNRPVSGKAGRVRTGGRWI